MNNNLYLFTFFITTFSFSQVILEEIDLPKVINETSGLEYHDNFLITLNDSGNDPILYYLNDSGKIIKNRQFFGIDNNDWEDLTSDDKHIYIADIGNNFDIRKNLSIIKVNKNEEIKNIEHISFNYPEQKSFSFKKLSMFDAEALISIKDYLLIFTKNRAKKITDIYRLPKIPGNYNAKKIGSLDVKSIITAADYNENSRLLVLTSTINFDLYYIIIIENFTIDLSNIKIKMYEIPVGKTQIESIKIIDSSTFWLTSEHEKNGNPKLYKLKI